MEKKPSDGSVPRKPYRAPKLTEYGDLRKIVLAKAGIKKDTSGPATKF